MLCFDICLASLLFLGVYGCPDPGVPLHGSRDLLQSWSSDQLPPQTVIHFSCNEGFLLDGPPKIICTQEGQWLPSHYPSCIAEDPCSLNPCQNGATCVERSSSPTRYHCHCPPVYHGDQCQERMDCALPPDSEVPNSHYTVSGQLSDSPGWYLPGSILTYECNAGYILHRGSTTRQCQTGRWVGETLDCVQQIFCDDPGIPDNAHRCCQNVFHSQVRLSYYCEEGYILSGSEERTCQFDGTWSGIQPVCTKVHTPAPTPVSDSMFNTETLTIVMATTGSILGILVVTVILTSRSCRSRTHSAVRGYPSVFQARLARLHSDPDATALLAVTDNINVVLPSYDEAVANVRSSQPPPFEASSAGSSEQVQQEDGDDSRSSMQGRPLPPLPPPRQPNSRSRRSRGRRSGNRQPQVSTSPPPYDGDDEPIDISTSPELAGGENRREDAVISEVSHCIVGNDVYAEVTPRREVSTRGSPNCNNSNSDDELLPLDQEEH